MRRYFVFATVGLVLFLHSTNMSSVSVAFPVIIDEFQSSLVLAGWVLSVYQLMSISAMPLAAKFNEVYGRKPVFLSCVSLFTLGSILCAVAPNMILLILFRVIQAIGGGGIIPTATGIISDEFPEMRQRAIGLFTSIFPIGAIVGPNLGGVMVEYFGWSSVFWFNVPLGIIGLASSWHLLKSSSTRLSGEIDFIGAALLIGFITSFMLFLTGLGNRGFLLLPSLLLGLSIILLIAFIRRERSARGAIISLELMQRRPFLATNIYNLVYGACVLGVGNLIPLYASLIYGKSLLEIGLIMTPRSVGMMLASTITSFFLVRWGYRKPILISTSIAILSLLLLAGELPGANILGIQLSDTTWLMVMMAIFGLALGLAAPASNNACIELMPDKVATITGLRGMFRQLGGSLSITVSTLLLEGMSNISRAFQLIFITLAIILFLAIPAVFSMPKDARIKPAALAEESRAG